MLRGANLRHAGQRADALHNLVKVDRRLLCGTRLPTRWLDAETENAPRIEPEIDATQTPQRLRHQARADDEHHGERDFHDDERLPQRHAGSARGAGTRHAQRAFGIDSRREQCRRYPERESDGERDDR